MSKRIISIKSGKKEIQMEVTEEYYLSQGIFLWNEVLILRESEFRQKRLSDDILRKDCRKVFLKVFIFIYRNLKKCHYGSERDRDDCPGKEEMEIAECGGVDRHFTGDQHCGEEPCHEADAD